MQNQIGAGWRRIPIYLFAGVLATLTGCIGDSDDNAEPPEFSASTSGVAAKGIIKSGLVTAEELDDSGNALRTLGTTQTAANGTYSLPIGASYAGGAVRLTLTDNAGGTARMVCDVAAGCGTGISFGDDVPLPAGFSMQAILPVVSAGETVSAQITPFTNMAARRLRGASHSANNVRNALSEVSQVVGVNVLTVQPVNIADPTDVASASAHQLAYAAFTAGAGAIAFANAGGFAAGLEALAESFADGDLDPNKGDVDPAALIAAVQGEVASNTQLASPLLDNIVAVVNGGIDSTGAFNPEPASSATLSGVERGRALVAETRSWLDSIAALETPAQAFEADFNTVSGTFDVAAESALQNLARALGAVGTEFDARSLAGTLSVPSSFDVTVTGDLLGVDLGTVTVTLSDNNGLQIGITGDVGDATVEASLSSDLPVAALDSASVQISGLNLTLNASVENASAAIEINQAAFESTLAAAVVIDTDTGVATDPVSGLAVDPQLSSIGVAGQVVVRNKVNQSSFTGSADIAFVSLNLVGAENPISLRSVGADGVFAASSGRFSAAMELVVNNAGEFDTIALLDAMDDDFHQGVVVVDSAMVESDANAQGVFNVFSLHYDSFSGQTCYGGQDNQQGGSIERCVQGDVYGLEADALAATGASSVVIQNSFYDNFGTASSEIFYQAEVDFGELETTTSFADVTATVTLDLALTGHPDTQAVLTANRDELDGGDVTVTFSHGGQSLRFNVDKSGANPGTASITVTNPDGDTLAVNVTEGQTEGTVVVNGTQVGTISEATDDLLIVRYNDGTFESVN